MSVKSFLAVVPGVVKSVVSERHTVLASVCIAQAALESGWNETAKTLFGIKGNGASMLTREYENGKWITVAASFKSHESVLEAVLQYYDLMSTNRYKNVKNYKTYDEQIRYIASQGYATDPDYATKICRIVKKYNLTQYDTQTLTSSTSTKKSFDEIVSEVIKGKWCNGSERIRRLTAAGYNYNEVQKAVNAKLKK